jgi:hypothetical protein
MKVGIFICGNECEMDLKIVKVGQRYFIYDNGFKVYKKGFVKNKLIGEAKNYGELYLIPNVNNELPIRNHIILNP